MLKVKLAGIYKIEHKSGYYYIGMSTSVYDRFSGHYSDIKINRHSSPKFVDLWNSTEPTEWVYSILEVVSITEFRTERQIKGKALTSQFRTYLLSREREWMSKYPKSMALNKDNKWYN